MDDVAVARGIALTQFDLREMDLKDRYREGWGRWKLSSDHIAFLSKVHGATLQGRMLWCNRHVRRAATEAIIDAFLADFISDPAKPRNFITFCWDAGLTWERQPRIDSVSLQNIVQHRLRRLGLQGIGVVEIDVLTNITGEPGRRLLVHVHCYCWGQAALPPIKTARALSMLPALTNALGAASVTIEPVRLSEISVAWLAAYMFKPPSREKNRIPRRNVPGAFVMREARLKPASAVRLVELLSHFEFGDLLFSVGEGRFLAKTIRENFRGIVVRWSGRRWTAPSAITVAAEWKTIRMENGSRKLEPCKVRARARGGIIDASKFSA